MAAEKSYARLGLFVVLGVAVVLATGLFFVQRMRSRAVISMVTYTTENVSGLDISSPVRFRGVSVGRVTDIRVDAMGNRIEIAFEVFQDRLVTIGANVQRLQQLADLAVFPQLRSRVVGNPVTGDAYLLLDIPANPPPPVERGFHAESALCGVNALASGNRTGSAAGRPGARRDDAADTQGDRDENSRQSRPERPVLHQMSNASSGRASRLN